jgi:hypothetical protein
MQSITDFHHQIAHALFPQADSVFHNATALNTTVNMLHAQSAIVQSLIGPLLFAVTPLEFMKAIRRMVL